jgi:hypothetical protein
MATVCVPSSLKEGWLFYTWLLMKKHSCAVGNDEYTVHKWRAEDSHFFTYYETSTCTRVCMRARTRTHTQQLKTKWHSAAYISSYRPQQHSQVPRSMAYDMFIIKGKYCEQCNTTVLHCISVKNSQRMWIYPTQIVAVIMKNHVPGYPVHHTWHLLTSTCVDTKELVLLDHRHEMNSYGTQWMMLSNWTVMKANRKQHTLLQNRLLLCTRSCWTVSHLIMYSVITYVKHNYTTK